MTWGRKCCVISPFWSCRLGSGVACMAWSCFAELQRGFCKYTPCMNLSLPLTLVVFRCLLLPGIHLHISSISAAGCVCVTLGIAVVGFIQFCLLEDCLKLNSGRVQDELRDFCGVERVRECNNPTQAVSVIKVVGTRLGQGNGAAEPGIHGVLCLHSSTPCSLNSWKVPSV